VTTTNRSRDDDERSVKSVDVIDDDENLTNNGQISSGATLRRGPAEPPFAEGFIGMARQMIDVCETIAVEHPIRAVHDMYRAPAHSEAAYFV
jgi:hypothetical protein